MFGVMAVPAVVFLLHAADRSRDATLAAADGPMGGRGRNRKRLCTTEDEVDFQIEEIQASLAAAENAEGAVLHARAPQGDPAGCRDRRRSTRCRASTRSSTTRHG